MLEPDIYKTIEQQGEAIYTEKRSKFLAFAIPVTTIEQVKEYIEVYQKKYYDARHVCYAYRLGERGENERSNDNGEPSGTAGKPILGQIHSQELTNVLVIVVRYFGGVKLGTSGLIVAYRAAAAEALEAVDSSIILSFSIENLTRSPGFGCLLPVTSFPEASVYLPESSFSSGRK